MNPLVVAIAILGGVILCVVVLHWVAEAIRRGAVAEARVRQMEQEIGIAAKQAAEVMKERTVEDVVRDLDAGQF